MKQPPAFISFTGADRTDLIDDMRRLSDAYPVEWGLLIDVEQAGDSLFPTPDALAEFLRTPSLRYSAHVCGEQARLIANDPEKAKVDLGGFQRLQINHSFSGSDDQQISNCVQFGRSRGIRTMLQCQGDFPTDNQLDWLFDTSFGAGKKTSFWPVLRNEAPFCGYSGGINPDNVGEILHSINASSGLQYWIDMESGVRTDGEFDISRCERVCRQVYG